MSRIRADKLVNRAGTGAPELPFGLNAPNGLNVTGVVTATSYRGDGSQLTGIDASALKDGSNVKVQATATGATVTGTLVADVTGNVTGNLTGDSTGTHTGNVTGTATTAINLADAGNITTGNIADARFPAILPAVSGANLTNIPTKSDIDILTSNIAMLGFKVAVNGSLTKFNLVDQIIDEFTDASGIDSGASTNIGVTGSSAGKYYGSIVAGNYFGDESDGAFTSSGLHQQTVLNQNGSYDGDMVIRQYSSFTLNSGHTYRPNQPCRGMIIYCTGNMVINGTIDMTGKGAKADPTNTASWNSAGSDGNTVGSNGLQIGLLKSGSTDTFTNDGSGFNGCGTAARTAVANQQPISGNGKIYTIARQGAGGGAGASGSAPLQGSDGSPGASSNQTGGGGGGSTSNSSITQAGNGAYGSCWSGGSGGGGTHTSNGPGVHAEIWGGAGGGGNFGGNAGGAGNPGGAGNSNHGSNGETGTGGTLIIICGGTISGNGTLRSVGSNGGAFVSHSCGGGGGSGGGAILVLANQSTFTGTLTAAGGTGTQTGNTNGSADGGDGGAGYTLIETVDGPNTVSASGILQSVDTTASSVPSKSDLVILIENASGTATLNTDIKAYVSRDSGTTFTQGTLVDEGTWGTNKKIVAFHDLDISSQPSGTSMCYKIELANQAAASKETRIHAVSHGWA